MDDQADPHVLQPGHHPTPFTAAEIRAASLRGRTVRQRIEIDGETAVTRVQQWLAVDEEGATRGLYTLDPDGHRTDLGQSRSTWLELQSHASMPVETTTIDAIVLDSPMGPRDCLRYTTLDGDAIETFWFARAYPGMPVKTERAENGRVVERVTMLSSTIEPIDTSR